jgi:hypothetical protein
MDPAGAAKARSGDVSQPGRARPGRLEVDGLVNARDLGGLRRRNGAYTPRGVFYRSENADWITAAGWDQVGAEGIRTIVDLRRPDERAAAAVPEHLPVPGLTESRCYLVALPCHDEAAPGRALPGEQ